MNSSTGLTRLQKVSEEKLRDARELRKNATPAESLLWERLRNRQCGGYKFRRQQVIEGYIADFFCEQSKLAVEIDGGVHSDPEQAQLDEHREKIFRVRGIRTIRFPNESIVNNLTLVLNQIAAKCNESEK